MTLLLDIARKAIASEFGEPGPTPRELEQFPEARGVFVTLKLMGALRGCIGYPEPDYPLGEACARAAAGAAFHDPRFSPLTRREFKACEITVSVLTVPEAILSSSPDERLAAVDIGKDGLIVESSHGRGLLLPQVAVEHSMDSAEFLQAVCAKAYLPPDAWKHPETKLYRFQAVLIDERNQT